MISSIHDGRDHRVVDTHSIVHTAASINDRSDITGIKGINVPSKRKLCAAAQLP